MEVLMVILHQLGLNDSFFLQFIIFAIAYVVLSRVVFKPYTHALALREKKTTGGEEAALETEKKSQELRSVFEAKARQVSTEIKNIFDEQRSAANKEYDAVVSAARTESQALIENTRKNITSEIEKARKEIVAAIPVVAQEISKKLLSK
jgi:F-type H+-transporting ATPase subunit b